MSLKFVKKIIIIQISIKLRYLHTFLLKSPRQMRGGILQFLDFESKFETQTNHPITFNI